MSKDKYYYDPETLSYRPIRVTNKNRIYNILLFTFLSFFFGVTSLLILLNSDTLNTPSELAQKRTLRNYEFQLIMSHPPLPWTSRGPCRKKWTNSDGFR